MLLKTKLLISLASISTVGGAGAGIYYGVIKNNESDATEKSAGTGTGAGVTPGGS